MQPGGEFVQQPGELGLGRDSCRFLIAPIQPLLIGKNRKRHITWNNSKRVRDNDFLLEETLLRQFLTQHPGQTPC